MDKEKIINQYSKFEFENFLKTDNDGKLLELLDQEGLSILDKSKNKKDRINYILAFSNYKNELFQNKEFLSIFFKTDLSYYYASLNNLNNETYDFILNSYLELNTRNDQIAQLFCYFSDDYKLKKLNNWPYNISILYEIINMDNIEDINCILSKYNIDLSDERIYIEGLIRKAKDSALEACGHRITYNEEKPSISIPGYMINEDLAKRLLKHHDIFDIRKLINDLAYSSNTDIINNYIKEYEDNIINSSNESIIYSPYKEIFDKFYKMKNANNEDDYISFRREYIRLIYTHEITNIDKILEKKYKEKDMSKVYEYIKELSDRRISNYIIDYHFEENYHNIMIDIQELLRFYYDGNIVLQEDHVELYKQISNIDYLSIEEKKQLHKRLKQINIQEMFYDDMASARYIVNEAIKEVSISRESIKKYKNERLSLKYGVDVYTINNEPFFGIVKTGEHISETLPTGRSYSLIGNDCIAVFGDPKNSNTFLYDAKDLNPEQIVHVFPFDSFTLYKPYVGIDVATTRVNRLMMPQELTGLAANCYNELLILEQGKTQTDIDDKIPKLKKIALYCLDEIREQDIEKAKDNGLGILLIRSKNYFENKNYYDKKFKDSHDYHYLINMNEKKEFEYKR